MLGEQVSEEPCGRCLALPAYWQLRGRVLCAFWPVLGPQCHFWGIRKSPTQLPVYYYY